MTIVQLEYILAVEKEGHFGRAARACHVTQPTLSMQVLKLEEFLGFSIFDREKNPVIPTEKGILILKQAKIAVSEFKKINSVYAQNDPVSGTLQVGIIPTLAPSLIPLFIHSFEKKYPKIDLFIEELQTPQIIQALLEDRIDVGLLVTPLNIHSLEETALFYEPFYGYFSKNHKLLKKEKIKPQDLHQNDLWLLSEGHCFRNQTLQICKIKNKAIHHRTHFESGSLETLIRIIDAGEGYTLLPELTSTSISNHQKKKIRAFEGKPPTREVGLVYTKRIHKRRLIQKFKEAVIEKIPKHLLKKPKEKQIISIEEPT
ncbi:MAG: DNA-binding transcriptional regulator OxyR [Bdellovibrionaceae bacterium]|nr:DNA-binding transcriptional regulator OxyR [Pseudobdellovibrionaceae bacterium]|tara:strand:+ start:555 stop:1499 length:945 start_codon:yes stop_codon:yes gene_type:complete